MVNLRDFEIEARKRLDPTLFDYFAGGARDEVTVAANEAGFASLSLLPRVLAGKGEPQLGCRLFGADVSMPVLIAPTAFHCLVHAEGERATARAAAAAGTIMIVSMASTTAIEAVAQAARDGAAEGPGLWFQLYIQPDLEFTEAVVRRAEEAGCRALVVTADSPVLGGRERDVRNGFHDLPPGLRCENMCDPRPGRSGEARSIAMFRELSWSHLEWLRKATSLPIVLKGVLHPADALLALEHGVDGLIVSNHGGRQLDSVPATIDQLPEIASVTAGRIPLLLDGGIRRGTDVVKALALGTAAVAIGRPVIWGLAVAGEDGAGQVLEILRAELAEALTLCGCGSIRDLGRDFVRPRGRGHGC